MRNVSSPYSSGAVPPSVEQIFAASINLFYYDRKTSSIPCHFDQPAKWTMEVPRALLLAKTRKAEPARLQNRRRSGLAYGAAHRVGTQRGKARLHFGPVRTSNSCGRLAGDSQIRQPPITQPCRR